MADGQQQSGSCRKWKVVGGTDKGGILVREGCDLTSAQSASRLATAALVEELQVSGERLHFKKLEGIGPDTGWVSIRLKDKELLVIVEDFAPPPAAGKRDLPAQRETGNADVVADVFLPLPPPVPTSRKVCVLCLHGTAGSPNVLKAQLRPLLSKLEQASVEPVFLEGHLVCTEEGIVGEQVRLMRQYFPAEVFKQYAVPTGGSIFTGEAGSAVSKDGLAEDPATWRTYEGLDDCLSRAQGVLENEAPVDALLGFSQGSNIATILMAQAALGRGANIRCVVHICTSLPGWTKPLPGQVPELFQRPVPRPALVVHAEKDLVSTGSDFVAALYENPERMSHSDVHRPLPANAKEAHALAENIIDFLLRHCRG